MADVRVEKEEVPLELSAEHVLRHQIQQLLRHRPMPDLNSSNSRSSAFVSSPVISRVLKESSKRNCKRVMPMSQQVRLE